MAQSLASSFIEVYKVATHDVVNLTTKFRPKETKNSSVLELLNIFDAIKAENTSRVLELLAKDGYPNADDHGHTLAHWAALHGNIEVISYLIENKLPVHCPSSHKMGQYPIHWACVNNHCTVIDLLLRNGVNIDQRDASGITPLLVAAQYGSLACCAFLIGKNVDLQARDNDGDTALHWAAFSGHSDLCRFLVYSGLDPHQPDLHGQYPVHLACISGNLRTVKEFCQVDKVNHSLKDIQGRKPRDLAFGRKFDSIVMFLDSLAPRRLPRCDMSSLIFGPTGTRSPIIFLVICIIFWGYPMYAIKAVPMTFDSNVMLHVCFLICNVVMWLSLYHANGVDPGYLPRNTREYDEFLKRLARPNNKDTVINSLDRLCHTCRTIRPLRTSHCRYCNRCVEGLDHHCPYINNCVGCNNRHTFLIFITSCLFVGLISLKLAYSVWAIEEYAFRWDYFIGISLMKIFGLLVLYICIVAWYNAFKNLTTNEKLRWRRYRYLQDATGRFFNPFDLGPLRNILYHFYIWKIYVDGDSLSST